MTLFSVRRTAAWCWLTCLALSLCAGRSPAAPPTLLEPGFLDALTARPIGPANMGGRVVGVAPVIGRPGTLYVATASGGLWKTVNNGTTFTPVFEHESTSVLGAVAVAPSDPDVVWVGTGEANPRNSVGWGDGVYKSTDGGRTWRNMGLRDSAHVGRIVIHPRDPNTVYAAALGRLWAPSKERGLFKTTDGGQTWANVLPLDEDTGCIDVAMDPAEPDTLYAAAYCVRRDGFSGGNPAVQFGPKAGLYRTTDGGKTWERMLGGLPTGLYGRCGLAVWHADPRILYAVVQTDQTLLNRETEWGQPAKSSGRAETGGVFRSDDRGRTWRKLNDLCPRPFYFSQIRIDPADAQRVYVLGVSLHMSRDGGQTFEARELKGVHGDHHDLWIDPRDPRRMVLGNDGGVYFSYDRGANWEHLQNLPIGQFYAVAVDQDRPYFVYGGLQDSGTWGGPSLTRSPEGITLAHWRRVLGGDGFYCQVDPTDSDTVYAEMQYGRPARVSMRRGSAQDIRPKPTAGSPEYRFNWSAPFFLSPHDPRVLYFGGNHVFRSANRGDSWEVISPDLTRGRPGPDASTGHTITTLAESPVRPGLLWAGTDDGRVHVRRAPAASWLDVSDRIPGVPPDRWVTRLECSHFAEGTAYLTLDRHRQDDRRPYVFKTTDYGATWRPLTDGLPPNSPVQVIREDLRNRDLLFAGTEHGLFVTLDGGLSWQPLRGGLPTVPVHDLVIHPREHELVIATHGRSLYVLDVAPLEELTPEVLATPLHLCEIKPGLLFHPRAARWLSRAYAAPNPPPGAVITYYLRDKPASEVRVTITDPRGRVLAEFQGKAEAGLHQLHWDLHPQKGALPGPPSRAERPVPAGEYTVQLRAGDRLLSRKLRVEAEE